MRRLIATTLSLLAAAALALPVTAAPSASDKKAKTVKTDKKAKKKAHAKARKPKQDSASSGATATGAAPAAAPRAGTDLGFEAERDEARIRRRNAEQREPQ